MLTMKDIAALSGYSRMTVYKALNNRPNVSARARKIILAISRQHHYQPNRMAVSLRGKPTRLIGVIVRDMGNPYFMHIVEGIEAVLDPRGYRILVISTHENPEREYQAIQSLLAYQVDGLILCPVQRNQPKDHFNIFQRYKKPLILIEPVKGFQSDYVDFQNAKGGYLATRHLLDQGHRKICYLSGPETAISSAERFEGFNRALKEARVKYQDWMFVQGGRTAIDSFHAVRSVLQRRTQRPTAIFCFSDLTAVGVYKAAQELGLRLPQDLSIVGFDDIALASVLGPSLTTVGYGIRNVGKVIGSKILERIETQDQSKNWKNLFEPQLIERESVQRLGQ